MYFLNEDVHLQEKYNFIWDKVSTDVKKEFDIESIIKNFRKPK